MTRNKKKDEHDHRADNTLQQPLAQDRLVVPLIEEELLVNKEWKQAGEAVIRKRVETTTESVPVELLHEEVHVDRVPVNRVLADGENAAPWQDGDVLVVPVIEEELIVMKRRVVREELRITKQRLVRQETVQDTVRKERIDIDTAGQVEALDDQPSHSG